MLAGIAASLVLAILVSLVEIPIPDREDLLEVPDRVAKLIETRPKPPPAQPVPEEPPEVEEMPEPEPEPVMVEELPEEVPEIVTPTQVADKAPTPKQKMAKSRRVDGNDYMFEREPDAEPDAEWRGLRRNRYRNRYWNRPTRVFQSSLVNETGKQCPRGGGVRV